MALTVPRPRALARIADRLLADNGLVSPMRGSAGGYEDPTIPQSKMPPVQPFRSYGSVGTVFFNGSLRDLTEYNPEIADWAWFDVADKMWRSSSAVRAVTACIILPLLRGNWFIRPPADPTDEETKHAQLCHDQIFTGSSVTWRRSLQETLLSILKYGHFVGEKCWAPSPDGYGARFDRLAPRPVRTLYRWYLDPKTDTLDRIQQRVWVPNEDGTSGTWELLRVPASKLLLFTYQQEGNYFKGTSLYRHMYRDFYSADNLTTINAIAIERNGSGIPWFDEPENAQESDRAYARRVLESLHVHETLYGTSPFGWQFDLKSSPGGKEALPSIEFHNRQIYCTGLATFAVDAGGSYAKSQDLSSFFTESLYSLAEDICEVYDRGLIREIVDINFGPQERYPSMHCIGIDRRQVGTWIRGLGSLFVSGAIHADQAVENTIRGWFDMPEVNPDAEFNPPDQPTVDTGSQGEASSPQTSVEEGLSLPVVGAGRQQRAAGEVAGGQTAPVSGTPRAPASVALSYDERLADATVIDIWRQTATRPPEPAVVEEVRRLLGEAPPAGLSRGAWRATVLTEAGKVSRGPDGRAVAARQRGPRV